MWELQVHKVQQDLKVLPVMLEPRVQLVQQVSKE